MKTIHESRTDKLHSVESAAEFLGGLSPATIRAWLTQKKLHRVKIGRRTMVRESELRALIHEEIAPAEMTGHSKGAVTSESAPTPKESRHG
jgi:Helix-turn-helix domain